MKLSKLARIYKTVNESLGQWFYNAEVLADHDEIYIHLAKSHLFSDIELAYLGNELGMHVHTTADSDNDVQSFVIYL